MGLSELGLPQGPSLDLAMDSTVAGESLDERKEPALSSARAEGGGLEVIVRSGPALTKAAS
jgi:hypothetical protein